jgi:hypothetical protein
MVVHLSMPIQLRMHPVAARYGSDPWLWTAQGRAENHCVARPSRPRAPWELGCIAGFDPVASRFKEILFIFLSSLNSI